jgi:hypothetical protein
MNRHNESFLRRAHKDQRGQVLAVVLVMLVVLLGFAAFVVDFGLIYISYRELQTSTDAAALAGAEVLPNSTATTTATLYSGVSGNKNSYSNLPNVTMVSGYPKLKCLTTLTNQGIACVAPANANAIQVMQQVSVPLTFARLVGANSVTLTATASAAMRGAAPAPYNVVIVVDSTASMNDSDGGSNCTGSRESCALAGVQILLGELSPCGASLSSCGQATGGQVTNPVDQVSLLTFPAVTTATTADDYNCGGSTPTIEPYPLPTAPSYTTYSNLPKGTPTTTYQVVNFSSDYRTSDTATSLNTSSDLVLAANGKTGCTGLQAIGGEGTYYAGAIYSAESLLVAQQAANPGTQNALILISDGDASATSAALPGASTKSGLYPSTVQQCHQAITAAQWAATQGVGGTKVYAVAYGAEASGCSTDTSPTISPCQTMQQIASSPAYFYTDYTSSNNGGCVSASQPTTNLNQIFTEIAGDFTVARLIPDNTQ